MIYLSTRGRGQADGLNAVLDGLAPDGGLFVDPTLGRESAAFDWQGCLQKDALGMAEALMSRLLPDFPGMGELVRRAYEGKFDCPELTPLVPVGDLWCLELYHGPTAAFKDVALSMLPQLIRAAREESGAKEEILILTATSGDTGKAALEGFHDVPGTRILVFYPHGGVSEIQRRQMVTQRGDNVSVCALEGNFDDCQRAVKRAFASLAGSPALAARGLRLSSANSINVGRLAPQLVYYFIAYAELLRRGRIALGERVDFAVPTGNFGDILAGWMAKRLGLPVGKLICASNANRVLADFIETGVYDRRRALVKTSSPSMDILVSSNLERLLYYLSEDPDTVRFCMERLEREGVYRVEPRMLERIREDFDARACGEKEARETIRRVWERERYLIDPHTAAAFSAVEGRESAAPTVVLSTASPYKFPAAVLEALGLEPGGDGFAQTDALEALCGRPVPRSLAALREAPERHRDVIGVAETEAYILAAAERRA